MSKVIPAMLLIAACGFTLWPTTGEAQAAAGYPGVVPGSGNNLPKVAQLKGQTGTWVTWPGFLSLPGGGSRVFLQTTGTLSYERTDDPKRLTIVLDGAKVFLSNNRNPLETAHFSTPVNRAYLKTKKKQLSLIIELRAPSTATISQATEADGYSYLFIDFPPGDFTSPGATATP